jgi:predicted aspartyl protease
LFGIIEIFLSKAKVKIFSVFSICGGNTLKPEQAIADVKLSYGSKFIELKALVDTGASKSVISKRFAEMLNAFIPLKEPYELRTADEEGRLKIIGRCMVSVEFQGVKVPGGAVFEVAENLRKGVELIIGRPEIDSWDIVFTSEGPRLRRVPLEFEII